MLRRAALVFTLAVFGCEQKPKPSEYQLKDELMQTESPTARIDRWRSEADAAILNDCSNAVIGFRRVIEARSLDTYQTTDINKWTGNAKVEFINKLGGAEETNLPYRFGVTFGKLYAHLDREKLIEQDRLRFEKEMRELKNGDDNSKKKEARRIKDGVLPHKWTFESGATFEAYYVSATVKGVTVKQKSTDGTDKYYTLPLNKLCLEDTQLLTELLDITP